MDNEQRNPAKQAVVDSAKTAGDKPSLQPRKLLPGEYDKLLERYKVLAERLQIDRAPELELLRSSKVGPGALSRSNRIVIYQPILDIMNPAEEDFMLAHELGHEKDRRTGKVFSTVDDCETSADLIALKVTGNPDAAIGLFRKLTAVQKQEYTADLINTLPLELREKASAVLKQRTEAQLDARIRGIKAAPSSHSPRGK